MFFLAAITSGCEDHPQDNPCVTEPELYRDLDCSSEPVCSSDGWCWRNPVPWGVDFNAIWGTNACDVWAVGNAGTIWHWDGSTWESVDSGTTANLLDVMGADREHVWAVGERGSVLFFNGTAWRALADDDLGKKDVYESIWVKDRRHVWMGGYRYLPVGGGDSPFGMVWFSNGISWKIPEPGPAVGYPCRLWGLDSSHVWAIGYSTIAFYDGKSWSTQAVEDIHPTSAWALDKSHVWVVGQDGKIMFFDGREWTFQESGTGVDLLGLWGTDAERVWAVGKGGTILFWDGSAWRRQESGTRAHLTSVWAGDFEHVWAAGTGGTMLYWNGFEWKKQNESCGERWWLLDVWGSDSSHIWAVSREYSFKEEAQKGGILFWDGAGWEVEPGTDGQTFYDVWGSDSQHVWAVGEYGVILFWDGSTWTSQESGFGSVLHAVSGLDAEHVWALGAYGTILFFDGSVWSEHSTIGRSSIDYANDIWVLDTGHIWVAATLRGDSHVWPAVFFFDGVEWAYQGGDEEEGVLRKVWGTDANHVWAVGSSIMFFDGAASGDLTRSMSGWWGTWETSCFLTARPGSTSRPGPELRFIPSGVSKETASGRSARTAWFFAGTSAIKKAWQAGPWWLAWGPVLGIGYGCCGRKAA
jgi:hypothetical protein